MNDYSENMKAAHSFLNKEIESLKAENARLREALERIDNECSRDDTTAWKIANDALEELK